MPRGTKRAEAKAEKSRQILIETIAKINDLEPTLGGKWKRNMVLYYQRRLAELLLYQSGFSRPSKRAIEDVAAGIAAILDQDSIIGG